MHDLIFVSMEDWDEIWRRNQFLASKFAQRFPENRILFVGLTRDFSHDLRTGKIFKQRQRASFVPDFPNILLTNPPKLLPNSIPLCRLFNDWMFRSHVRRASRRLGLNAPILWLNPHSAVHMVGRMDERAVIYDVTDDWTHFQQKKAVTCLTREQDRDLAARADTVIVCSHALLETRREYSKRIELIPNGVDVEHYSSVTERPHDGRWKTPVFGYTGSVHPQRVDVELVCALAQAFPYGSVVLVGPNMLDQAAHARLADLSNVHLVGAIPYAQIPDTMTQFDVCIVPHVESAFTESLNPIKLWEYLASGKPIVSTNVAGFRDYPQHVEIASGDEFVRACERVLEAAKDEAKASQKCEARRHEASGHSWESRLDDVLKVVRAISERNEP